MVNFLTEQDYKGVTDETDFDIISQGDHQTYQRTERVAMEEVASYLRPRYDTDMAFAARGDARNPMLVQIVVNITLYYMIHWLPQNMGLDARKELYTNAISWLDKVKAGNAIPDLPLYAGDEA